MCPDIVFFFNLIFDTGIEIGIIKRIYKLKAIGPSQKTIDLLR